MKTYKRYSIALNDEENGKLQRVKNYYQKGCKKIFMSMVEAMFYKLPLHVEETQGDDVNKSGIMRNIPGNEETE